MGKGGRTKNTSCCQLPHNGIPLERYSLHVPSTPNLDVHVVVLAFFFAQ
jgi:hypothetical protein